MKTCGRPNSGARASAFPSESRQRQRCRMTDSAIVTGWEGSNLESTAEGGRGATGSNIAVQGWGDEDSKQPKQQQQAGTAEPTLWVDAEESWAQERLKIWVRSQASLDSSEFEYPRSMRREPWDAWRDIEYIPALNRFGLPIRGEDVEDLSRGIVRCTTESDLLTPLVEFRRMFRDAPRDPRTIRSIAAAFIDVVTTTDCDAVGIASLCAQVYLYVPTEISVQFKRDQPPLPGPAAFRKWLLNECQNAFYPLAKTHGDQWATDRLLRFMTFLSELYQHDVVVSNVIFMIIHECIAQNQFSAAHIILQRIGRSLDLPATKPVLDKVYASLRKLVKDGADAHRDPTQETILVSWPLSRGSSF